MLWSAQHMTNQLSMQPLPSHTRLQHRSSLKNLQTAGWSWRLEQRTLRLREPCHPACHRACAPWLQPRCQALPCLLHNQGLHQRVCLCGLLLLTML